MSCFHMVYKSGTKTRSAYVPGYAQGAYFPGDEPGEYCKIYEELCPNENGRSPDECAIQENTNILCEDCGVFLKENGAGQIYCPNCMEIQKD